MPKFIITILLLAISGWASGKPVHHSYHPKSLRQGLQHILNSAHPDANIGIIVRDAKTDKVIFSRHSYHLYTPASTQKLFTAVAALRYLGPHFRFKTALLTRGKIKNHILNGNLIVKFGGDPELTSKDVRKLITALKKRGVHRIKGHVYIDNTAYGHVPYPPGWMWDDLSYSYAAPLNAIIINHNKFVLRLIPSKKIHHPPKIIPMLPDGVIYLNNEVTTTSKYSKKCPLTIYSDLHNHYRLAGCLNKSWGKQYRSLAIRNPLPYAMALIRKALQDNHITYKHYIRARKTPRHTIVLAKHSSPPLSQLLKEMLKTSDNLTADSLLKKMGQRYYKRRGTWETGLNALKKILKPTGINFKHCLINDGAGLSRYNLITPRQFSKLLYYAYHHPIIRKTLLMALPIGGKDGTLISRMHHAAKGQRVHAKTGTMSGVSALAGYIRTQHHGTLTFTIMINGFVGKATPSNYFEDRLCEFLAHYKGKTHG